MSLVLFLSNAILQNRLMGILGVVAQTLSEFVISLHHSKHTVINHHGTFSSWTCQYIAANVRQICIILVLCRNSAGSLAVSFIKPETLILGQYCDLGQASQWLATVTSRS